MTVLLLIVAMGAALLVLVAAGVLALLLACVRRRRAAVISAAVAAAALLLAFALGVGLGAKGLGAVRGWWSGVQARAAADEARRVALIERLKGYVDPAARAAIPPDFYTEAGFRDWWRYPLVYPYSVTAIDTPEAGALGREDGGSSAPDIHDITHVALDGRLLLIRQNPRPDGFTPGAEVNWILLEWETGAHTVFGSRSALLAEARKRGYTGPAQLVSLQRWGEKCFLGAP